MATNNNGNLLDSAGNVFVDFVWGNFPMQPNDERTTTADYTAAPSTVVSAANASGDYGWGAWTVYPSSRLNPTLSNHAVVEAAYAGFPAFASGDGAYISGTAYIQVPSVLGLTTANAIDALRDAGYESANITTATAATNTAKTVTAVSRTSGSTTIVFTASGAGAAYGVGTKVTVSAFTGGDAALNGTYTVTANATNTFSVVGTATTALALTAQTGSVVGVTGTIKTQSTAAGAGSVASTATITVTPWAQQPNKKAPALCGGFSAFSTNSVFAKTPRRCRHHLDLLQIRIAFLYSEAHI